MGFTNVAWESRDTEQLARDLTEGPGPESPGGAGAAWVRVANELAEISAEYDAVARQLHDAFGSRSSEVAVRKIKEFSRWLQALSLDAAGNGQRAQEAAVAYSVAVLAMPTVSEAVETQTARDVMASLEAYNGAVLQGRFAEFDEAATADRAHAAEVMYQYEESCASMSVPWQQPAPPDIVKSTALQAERDAQSGPVDGGGSGHGSSMLGALPPILTPFQPAAVKPSFDADPIRPANMSGGGTGGGAGGMGGGYAPMAAAARHDNSGQHESDLTAGPLAGAGEASLASTSEDVSWLPATAHSDGAQLTAQVSWGSGDTALGDDRTNDPGDVTADPDRYHRQLENVSQHWVAPAVIGTAGNVKT